MLKGQATGEVKLESLEIRRQIITAMSDKEACGNTFSGVSLGGNVSSIRNKANHILFQVGQKYGSNSLQLQSITVTDSKDLGDGMREAQLNVSFQSLKNSAYGSKTKNFKSLLKVKAASASAPITECFDDTKGIIATTCTELGGVWDNAAGTCTTPFVNKGGDTMTGNLSLPQVSAELFCDHDGNCRSMKDLALSGQGCPAGQVATGTNPDGSVRCGSSGSGERCASNMVMVGINTDGTPLCDLPKFKCNYRGGMDLVASCEDSEELVSCSSGSLFFTGEGWKCRMGSEGGEAAIYPSALCCKIVY